MAICEGNLFKLDVLSSPANVLHHHGLLAGRRVTCAPGYGEREGLENLTPPKAKVVVDGPCVTSVAAATAIEFALKLVELLYSQEKARDLASLLAR